MLLSITGLYEYDENVFNGLLVPDELDKNAVINEDRKSVV